MLDFDNQTLFVEVILPLSLRKNYTYRVPLAFNRHVQSGKRVLVQFGKKRIYTALIYKVTHQAPLAYEAKYLLDVVDSASIVTSDQIRFWEWISRYYMCNLGDVMAAALPSAFKWSSDSVLHLATVDDDISELSMDAQTVYMLLLQKKQVRLTDIMDLLQRKNVQMIVNELVKNDLAYLVEEITDKFKLLKKVFYQIHPQYHHAEARKKLFESLEKAPKQLDVLLTFIQLSAQSQELSRNQLLENKNVSASAIKALVDKEILIPTKRVVDRLNIQNIDFNIDFKLNAAQQKAKYEIEEAWLTGLQVVLLFGVTSSGKTQVYIKLIEDLLQKKPQSQVLFLLPEIALTTQLVERVKLYFGDQIGVYHSKFSDQERVEIWNKVINNQFQIVLGARSALFLPFQNLQMVIVDEEHEASFKQHDPAPRYQARDAAIILAQRNEAKVILGSATPSVESWSNAQNGKYGLVKLIERFGGVQLPEIEIIDIKNSLRNTQTSAYFSQQLVDEIAKRLDIGEQVILFQNRRGFSIVSYCKVCGYTPECVDCDVSLTFHKSSGRLHCHYCGFNKEILHTCPACGSAQMLQKGVGTEKIEEDLQILFPKTVIARLDLDSTRKKNSMQNLLDDFREGKIQILVGTQMVAKGLDFENVTLIGIMDADSILNYPDFRADERAYQLMAQVAGRAGRRQKQGKVCIQTYHPEHFILERLKHYQYELMLQNEIKIRQDFKYPPYFRLISIRFKHKDDRIVKQAAKFFAEMLHHQLGNRVLGPEAPLVARVRNLYIQQINLKIENQTAIQPIKNYLEECLQFFLEQKTFKTVFVQFDVDVY